MALSELNLSKKNLPQLCEENREENVERQSEAVFASGLQEQLPGVSYQGVVGSPIALPLLTVGGKKKKKLASCSHSCLTHPG